MKTIKVKELGIEVETEMHDKDKILSEVKIPEEWRLLRLDEIIFLHNNLNYRKALNLANTWEFLEQPFEVNRSKGHVVRFYSDSGGVVLSCDGVARVRDASLGVRFCRDVK